MAWPPGPHNGTLPAGASPRTAVPKLLSTSHPTELASACPNVTVLGQQGPSKTARLALPKEKPPQAPPAPETPPSFHQVTGLQQLRAAWSAWDGPPRDFCAIGRVLIGSEPSFWELHAPHLIRALLSLFQR